MSLVLGMPPGAAEAGSAGQAHFITVSRTLDSRPAAAIAALGLVPLAGPLVSGSMRLWRGAHVLGGEMVGDYVSKVIPHADRDAFWKWGPLSRHASALHGVCILSQAGWDGCCHWLLCRV